MMRGRWRQGRSPGAQVSQDVPVTCPSTVAESPIAEAAGAPATPPRPQSEAGRAEHFLLHTPGSATYAEVASGSFSASPSRDVAPTSPPPPGPAGPFRPPRASRTQGARGPPGPRASRALPSQGGRGDWWWETAPRAQGSAPGARGTGGSRDRDPQA